jgi:serine/threonine-protein kinase
MRVHADLENAAPQPKKDRPPVNGDTLTAVIVSALVSAGAYLAMHFLVAPRLPVHSVEVPPLVGMSPEQARDILEPRGLLLVLDGEQPTDRVAAGLVAEQHPLGGSRLRRGDEVHASVGRPGAALTVPPLTGMTIDAAREQLTRARLRAGSAAEAPSATVPKGLVADSRPPKGTEAKTDTVVDLIVSSGPPTQPVPQVVGKRLSTAKQLLEKAGFVVGATRYGSNDDYDQGVVIGQLPKAGDPAPAGGKIDLTIND